MGAAACLERMRDGREGYDCPFIFAYFGVGRVEGCMHGWVIMHSDPLVFLCGLVRSLNSLELYICDLKATFQK